MTGLETLMVNLCFFAENSQIIERKCHLPSTFIHSNPRHLPQMRP